MIKQKRRSVILWLCAVLFVMILTISCITACGGTEENNNEEPNYYLSLASNQWQTYESSEQIPDNVHFKHGGGQYTLEIALEEGEQFTVNKVGSDEKIGFDKIFSTGNILTRGDNGSIKVACSGTFVITYYISDNVLTFTYTAHRVSVEITTAVTTLHVGDTYTYKAKAVYSNGDQIAETAEWTSSNEAVLSVTANGEVSALSAGSATLTATIGGLSDFIEITVVRTEFPVSGVKLNKTELALELEGTEQLIATVLPEDADSKLVTWDSEDDTVATVSSEGMVTAVGYGTTTIIVSTAQGGFTAECEVTVIKHASDIRLDFETLSLTVDGKEKTLGIIFVPNDATYKEYNVEIVSGNEHISIQDDKKGSLTVSGLSVGEAEIKVSLAEDPDATASCKVTVYEKDSVVVDMKQNVTAMINETTQLNVSLENAEIENVTWSIGNSAVATIEGNGAEATIKGVDFGSTVARAKIRTSSGTIYQAECNVLVSDEWYFIYGYGLGASEYWDYSYVTDKNAAERDGLLFTEVERGIYTLTRYLTPDNGFQIIFPKVGNYSQYDEVTDKNIWNKNIPSQWVNSGHYYDAGRSSGQYLSNQKDYFCVNKPGVYAITLDLTGASAIVYIRVVSLDVESVSWNLEEGQVALKCGEEAKIGFAVTPSAATFTEDQVQVKLTSDFADFADFVKYEVNFADKTITVSVSGTVPQSFDVTLSLTIRGATTSALFYVLSADEKEVAVSSVTFEQKHYYVNVNQGGAEDAWQQVVKATVNQGATNQTVRYLDVTDYNFLQRQTNDTYATVNAQTGLVTGKVLGTITVKAVSLENEAFFDTCFVTFYSDVIYLIGGKYEGDTTPLGGWTPLDASYKSVKGTAFEEEQFEMLSETHFRLSIHLGEGEEFQIAFCGMDESWRGVIRQTALQRNMSNAVEGWNKDWDPSPDSNSVHIRTGHDYVIDLDLSNHAAFFTFNIEDKDEFGGFSVHYDTAHTDLKQGDKVEVGLYFLPDEGITEQDISYTLAGEEYLDVQFDYSARKFSLTVKAVDKGEDKLATLTVTVKGKSNSIGFKIVAEHHLKLMWDKDYHWMGCTDEGCDYIEGEKVGHEKEGTYTFSPQGHYYACSGCGIEFDFEPHQYDLSPGAVFDLSESKECSVCHHALFEINDGVLEGYYFTKAEKVKIPNTVTALGDHVFEGHSELKTLTNSEKLKKIGAYAFAGCTNLQAVKIPNPVTEIGMYAFQGTAATITWGRNPSINTIGKYAFYGYLGTTLTIPDTVTDLMEYCFANSNLQEFIIPDTVVNTNKTAGYDIFRDCSSLRKVVIGKGITKIEEYAFTNCVALETVFIRGTGFWTIGMFAFDGCDSIKEVYFERPLDVILTCYQLFYQNNDALKGHCYVYSATDPGDDPFGELQGQTFGYFRDWFAGCWQWDESGEAQTDMSIFGHVSLWDETQSAAVTTNMPVILDDRKNLYA